MQIILYAWLGTAAVTMLAAQTLSVTPAQVMGDEVATVRVTGLQSREHAIVRGELTDGAGQAWGSQAEFVADDAGTVDTSKQAPVKGSYRSVSAMGLVWSMMPAVKDGQSYRTPRNTQVIHFELMKNGSQIAAADLEQTTYPNGLRRINLMDPLHGVLLAPDTPGPHPGVLVLGGSEGGVPMGNAIWLASHGYAALALAYFHVPGLPQQLENIPLEYFGQAIVWMKQRAEIDPGRLAVMGGSRGGELALQLGSLYPDLHAVVAYVPANVRFPSCCNHDASAAWTWKGRALAYDLPSSGTDNPADPAAILVEQTNGPILMISGTDDGIWHSSEMADAAMRRLKIAKFRFQFEHLKYPHAGHRAGEPWIMPIWSSAFTPAGGGERQNFGGTPEGNAASTVDAGRKVLEFLRQGLSVGPGRP